MRCPHCGYQDYAAEPVEIGLSGYVSIVPGAYGEFYELPNAIMTRSPDVRKLGDHKQKAVFACPAKGCGKLFIEI